MHDIRKITCSKCGKVGAVVVIPEKRHGDPERMTLPGRSLESHAQSRCVLRCVCGNLSTVQSELIPLLKCC